MTDVRELLTRYCDAVGATQTPVALDDVLLRRGAPPRRARRLVAVAAVVVVLAAGLSTAVWLRSDRTQPPVAPPRATPGWQVQGVVATRPLAAVPEGVSVMQFGSSPTFVVRTGATVRVFLTSVQHLPGEDGLWWCPTEQVFASPTHGESFSATGVARTGPAQRGLEHLTVAINAGVVTARLDQITLGSPRTGDPAAPLPDGPWNTGPGSFCAGALENGHRVTPPALSRADAVQAVGRLTTEIAPGAVFAAKLVTRSDYQRAIASIRLAPADSHPGDQLWIVEVHGHLHPSFGLGDNPLYNADHAWGLYDVDATTGVIGGASLSETQPTAIWESLRDHGL